MTWLNKIVDELIAQKPEGEILIESGGSPSGVYHLGHMRELVTCDAIMLELQRRGRQAKHIYFVDDLDAFRKVPANIPEHFKEYLGLPLCDVPSPDGVEGKSYADYCLQGMIDGCAALKIDVEFVRSAPKYRSGWFVEAIELCFDKVPLIRKTLEEVSNRTLDEHWTPIQVLEDGRLKKRKLVSIDKAQKTITYENTEGDQRTVNYARGEAALDWRLDWPARWWKLGVDIEPFGREHASAGGSYDTGRELMNVLFKAKPPMPVGYDSIHMAGDTKKMSASKGTAISAEESVQIMPAEVVRYYILRSPLNRPVYFDPNAGVVRLIDEFAQLSAKERDEAEEQLYYASTRGDKDLQVSRVPFSHLVASYQAALKDADKTIEVIARTEYAKVALEDKDIIKRELKFIDSWLKHRAPEDVKFSLSDDFNFEDLSSKQKEFAKTLATRIAEAPNDADGSWFHTAIYDLKEESGIPPKEMFETIYKLLINKTSGPRAGWFLSMLPKDHLVKRLSGDLSE